MVEYFVHIFSDTITLEVDIIVYILELRKQADKA